MNWQWIDDFIAAAVARSLNAEIKRRVTVLDRNQATRFMWAWTLPVGKA